MLYNGKIVNGICWSSRWICGRHHEANSWLCKFSFVPKHPGLLCLWPDFREVLDRGHFRGEKLGQLLSVSTYLAMFLVNSLVGKLAIQINIELIWQMSCIATSAPGCWPLFQQAHMCQFPQTTSLVFDWFCFCVIHTLRKKVLPSTYFWCFSLSQTEDSIQYLEGPNGIWKHHDRHIGAKDGPVQYACHSASRYHLVLSGTE